MIARLFAPVAMKVAAGLQILSLGVIVFLLLAKAGETRRADKWQLRATETQAAFDKTVAEVRRVRAEQKAADEAHARKVEQAQAETSQEVANDYQKRLSELRARYDALRLSKGAPAADPRRAGGENLPGVSTPSRGVDGPAPPGLSLSDIFTCESQAIQLDELQRWIREQLAIPR